MGLRPGRAGVSEWWLIQGSTYRSEVSPCRSSPPHIVDPLHELEAEVRPALDGLGRVEGQPDPLAGYPLVHECPGEEAVVGLGGPAEAVAGVIQRSR